MAVVKLAELYGLGLSLLGWLVVLSFHRLTTNLKHVHNTWDKLNQLCNPAAVTVLNSRPRETLGEEWEDYIWEVTGRHVD